MLRLLLPVVALGALGACATSSKQPGSGENTAETPAPICAADEAALGAAPLRRLTRFEYGRTLADLVGADPSIANDLPPDEESYGFDDQADTYSVSTLHASKYLDVAERVAATLVGNGARLSEFAGCDPTIDSACVEPFVRALGRRVYRRTLTQAEVDAMLALEAATAAPSAADGVTAVVAAMLETPQFLYRTEPSAPGELFGPALATRLSFMITEAAPDPLLLDAAEAGDLDTNEGLLTQADRLLASPRAGEAFSHFMLEWWDLDGLAAVQKDQALYRSWDSTIPAEFAQETQAFLTAAWSAEPTLATFLGGPFTYVDTKLAGFYGTSTPTSTGFSKVLLDPTRAAGLLTQGSFLAVHAKPNQTSPIHRGKFVRERLLCDPPEPPPANIVVSPPTVDPRLSTRERFAQHTANALCAGCHAMMDPIGFLFEHYDAIGRWRDVDGGKPVDASGYLEGTDVDGDLDGVPALAKKLLASDQVRACVAKQWFRYAFGREATTPADSCTVGALAGELARTNGNLRSVIRATVEQQLFRGQRPEEATP